MSENDNTLEFKCYIEQPYIKADSIEPVERDILIECYAKDELRKDPNLLCAIHFILLLDISGSMDDELEPGKTKLDAVIDAVAHVIKNIKEDDLISVVTFSIKEKVFCWAESYKKKEELLKRLEEIYKYPRGATNLKPALDFVKENLEKNRWNFKDKAIKFLLLTDGEIHDIEECEPLAKEFHEQGIAIDTLGIGLDFHADDMEELTSGFMEKIENTGHTIALFEKSLRSLQNTVATKVKIELDPTEGVEIRGIAKISPDIKLLSENTRIISFENIDRNRRYAAIVRILIYPQPVGKKAVLTCTLVYDIPKENIIEETIEKVIAVNFTNNPNEYNQSPNSEVIHASTYYTIATKAQEIQENSYNKDLVMRNLKLIINRLKKIGDLETMKRWEAVRDDYIKKGEFSLEEYNKISISKSKTSTAYSSLPPLEVGSEFEDELEW